MILVKTPAGLLALRNRQSGLTPRQRTAFILFDGKRSMSQVLAATAAMGITDDDVQSMIQLGLLEAAPVASGTRMLGTASPSEPVPPPVPAVAEYKSPRSTVERYQAAYPIATALTASLGLRGFRLNLALERATSYEDLVALAPKIRAAVGDAPYARLEQALFS